MNSKAPEENVFDKYYYYHESVQSSETDVEFLRDTFKELRGRKATTLTEDFCGTFAISCDWVKLDSEHKSVGVDLDPEPIAYGQKNYLTQLNDEEQKRVEVITANVLSPELPQTDLIAAMNFSYFIFKKREELKGYLKSCYDRLENDGVLLMDCFGGSQCMEPVEEETEMEGFSYYWDQDSYDPVTNEALFYIHFKPKGEKKVRKAFTYDWRMYSIPEIKDILKDAGFKNVSVYWEGTDEDGDGDGEFKKVTKGEDCESWVAYIVSEKP